MQTDCGFNAGVCAQRHGGPGPASAVAGMVHGELGKTCHVL